MKSKTTQLAKSPTDLLNMNLLSNDFPVVGIGASAGGLEALEQFFSNMPMDTGMAFVVVQHLDPNHVGVMPELLQRITSMKVFQASDNLLVKPNCVYVIPPNKSMSILRGKLFLFDPVETRGLRLPIDIFFRSLADDKVDRSIGIILSGMGSDGSLGLKAIKEKNGMVLVQSPETAKFDGMPRSAIQIVIADMIAPADELPKKLIDFLKNIPEVNPDLEIDVKSIGNLEKIIILLREHSGHDFSQYKKNTLFRRIERRKGIHQFDKLTSYVRFCQENPTEVEILFKELLIGITSFFRDPAVWEKLKEQVLPEMISKLPDGTVMRAWVTACSTGEEAYSLAIIFREALELLKNSRNVSLQIFATDLDQDSIDISRRGFYPINIAGDIRAERLNRFFTPEADGYRVNASIREMVVFAPQNIIKDPPFTRLDILTCRNMLIYMEPVLQKKLIMLFNYSLNPDGIMVLGTAESFGNQTEGFTEVDSKLKIFKCTSNQRISGLTDFPSSFINRKASRADEGAPIKNFEDIQSLTDQFLLQRFAPSSILINVQGDILYMTGHIGDYIEPVAGKANWNIYAMAREGLHNELPGAIRKALQNFEEVILRNIKIGANRVNRYVDVTVQQIDRPHAIKGMIIILFTDVTEKFEIVPKEKKVDPNGMTQELEKKLQRSYADQQNTREEMQTSQEELKSTNEELQSTNEELQSTNEELTTSKEEMQSLNEELQTVNIELQSKITDFLRANDDMKNLLNSTEIATLFLDKELNIRRFTDHATTIFKLRKTDIGRPFTDLASVLQYPDIEIPALKVLDTLIPHESSIISVDGRWYKVRIMPYRTLDDRIDGLVITFSDITEAKKIEISLTISETRFRRLFESAKDGILILDAETGMIVDVNPFLIEMLGYSKAQFVERFIWQIGLLKDIVANKEKFIELTQKEIARYKNLPLETIDGNKINVEFVSNVYFVEHARVVQCFIREIKDKK